MHAKSSEGTIQQVILYFFVLCGDFISRCNSSKSGVGEST